MTSKALAKRLERIRRPDLERLRQAQLSQRIERALAGLSSDQLRALRALYSRGYPPTQEELESVAGSMRR